MHSFDIFHAYERRQWTLRDLPWQELDRSLARPEHIRFARAAVMGECNSIAALHGFLNESEDDYDFAAYASIWGYQELQHHYAFQTWLDKIGERVADRPVTSTRPAYPRGTSLAATLATNVISELTVCHLYRVVSQHVDEPVLKRILELASQDEARHAREFLHYLTRQLERRPSERASTLETLYVYTADPEREIKHPVSVFKGDLEELRDHETIDDAFTYFQTLNDNGVARVKNRIMRTFSRVLGVKLDTPGSIRRALAAELDAA